ncbi:MAG: hypothetical protein SWH68_13780 [Thermodesulfobacteriota bacterium]|nr:hypothetical protein [Thermodesulfobacteriota bacterium]
MKYFPLKILLVLAVLAPLMYLVAIQTLESVLEHRYNSEIENIYIGDTRPLFEGAVRLSNAVSANIDAYLQKRELIPLGVSLDVMVTAGEDTIIYPAPVASDAEALNPPPPRKIAAENYRLMNRGLSVNLDLFIQRGSVLDIFIFTFFLACSGGVFAYFYLSGARKARAEEIDRKREINRLHYLQQQHYDRLMQLNQEKQRLANEMDAAKSKLTDYKIRASQNEDFMIDEIMALEEKMRKNIELREELEKENEALKGVTEKYNTERRKNSKKNSAAGNAEKRFKTLYKNIRMHNRAVDGFLDLPEDMRIKAEEVIKQLDGHTPAVDIKRKVDLKKSHEKIFEIIFSYNGRLYFRNFSDGTVDVLAIGTKNTQGKDMSFLDTL